MKPWVGRSMIIIGALHSALGLVVFRDPLIALVKEGGFNTIKLGGPPDRSFAFWFLLCGVSLIIIGGMLDQLERRDIRFPAFVSWIFFAIVITGCFLMPFSGFWLLIAPVIGMFLDRRRRLAGELDAK